MHELIIRNTNDFSKVIVGVLLTLVLFASISDNTNQTYAQPSTPVKTQLVAPGTPVAQTSSTANSVTVSINRSSLDTTSTMSTGATHEHYDADPGNDPTAVASARTLMQNSLTYQNQQMMGWGADDPKPSLNHYDWSSLDHRVQLMRQTKATMVLTFCCAPGWMRPVGYQRLQDDWKYLEMAPDPTHVHDFANLTAAAAARYPDVKYFQVWNELKGMYSDSPGATPSIGSRNRWDYERYTTLYNAVYDAVKAVRPDAKIGGPYVSMDSGGNGPKMSNPGPSYPWGTLDQKSLDVISYWLKNKHGADFITIDGSSANNQDRAQPQNEFDSGQKFADVATWIRAQGDGGATLPLWWAEWYPGDPLKYPSTAHNLDYYNALMASDIIYMLRSGVTVPLIWQPQGDSGGYSYPEGIWTDTRMAGGGQATPYYTTSQDFKNFFGPGTPIYKTTSSVSTLSVLASATKTMLVNHLSSQQQVTVNGVAVTVKPYEVHLMTT